MIIHHHGNRKAFGGVTLNAGANKITPEQFAAMKGDPEFRVAVGRLVRLPAGVVLEAEPEAEEKPRGRRSRAAAETEPTETTAE